MRMPAGRPGAPEGRECVHGVAWGVPCGECEAEWKALGGTEHNTDSMDCWCDPMAWMVCPECNGNPEGCWKCRKYSRPGSDNASAHPTTAGLVPHNGDEHTTAIIIHRGPPDAP